VEGVRQDGRERLGLWEFAVVGDAGLMLPKV
jgi:hypothetical protein